VEAETIAQSSIARESSAQCETRVRLQNCELSPHPRSSAAYHLIWCEISLYMRVPLLLHVRVRDTRRATRRVTRLRGQSYKHECASQ
jgi:hypothetical protein